MTVEEKGLSLRGQMRILLRAALIIVLSIASTIVSFPRVVSGGWGSNVVGGQQSEELWEVAITRHGFPFRWYSTYRYTLGGQLETETFEFHSRLFTIDTITYITVYSVIATFTLWAYRAHAKVKVSKFQFLALVVISFLICGIIIGIDDILGIKDRLEQFYWIAENTHSGMVGWFIERDESQLYQKQTILMGLVGLTALIIVSSMLIKRKLRTRLFFSVDA